MCYAENMLADRIRKILERRPYWGPQTIAREVQASPHVVRVTASRHEISFMDRYEVEAYTDQLLAAIERTGASPDGEKVEPAEN